MKKFLALILVSAMLFAVGCNSVTGTSETSEITQEPTTETSSSETTAEITPIDSKVTSYPVTITDQAGREVVIEEEPKNLVSGYYITSSLFIALGIEDRMVGIESSPEKRPIYALSRPELLELPQVGSQKKFDFEACVALEPDLVVLPKKLSDVAEQLEALGIDAILVNPENEEGLIETINIISVATNSQKEADKLLTFIDGVKSTLKQSLSDVDPVSLYLGGNSSFLSTAASGMYQSDMIALAGGKNVGDEINDTYWVDVSYEQILAWNPQYIILASNAEYTVEDILNDKSLQLCDAVKNGKVYKLPSDAEAWDSPIPSCILGSLWIASVLYPDSISEEDCNKIIEEYYETFYGFSYSSIKQAEAA